MIIGAIEIITPMDDILYELDWRAKAAQAIYENGGSSRLPAAIRDDAGIKAMLAVLKGSAKQSRSCLSAMSTHRSDSMRMVVEAMLLTRADAAQISKATGIEGDAVNMYESLFFNVRDRDAQPIPAQLMRIAADLEIGDEPDNARGRFQRALRKAALQGFPLLMSLLPANRGSTEPEGAVSATTLVEQELNRRLLRGELSTSALLRLRSLQIDEVRMQYDTRNGNSDNEGFELSRKLLALMAPAMVGLGQDENPDNEQARSSIRQAEEQIAQVDLNDKSDDAQRHVAELLRLQFANVQEYVENTSGVI